MAFASLMGRLLIIPVALSGVCLSMLFGVPMAGAMEMDQATMQADVTNQHEMVAAGNLDHGTQPGCCTAARMEHDTKAAASDQGKVHSGSCVADVPRDPVAHQFDDVKSGWVPPRSLSLHQPFSLTGIIFKRE